MSGIIFSLKHSAIILQIKVDYGARQEDHMYDRKQKASYFVDCQYALIAPD